MRGASPRGGIFLSPRTIDFHLRNVFRKLGISSRTALARLDLDSEHLGARNGTSAQVRLTQ
jgi:DNA-binding NarL/FixJ family response regulator